MADTVAPQRRSEIMSRIRSKGMKPDLVFPSRRKVLFVHGCFWHQHADPVCEIVRLPQSNRDYWWPKLERNASRDAEQEAKLGELVWGVLILWECEVEDDTALRERIQEFLEGNG